ncbi:ribbon-helix-helix protein, CopG family [Pontibacterium sp.]|uniref:ribbon-helix-helix protein, CopG family n=1 Tax=Pontibacterium sp. TaxID=2036026 RepID=UPI003566E687
MKAKDKPQIKVRITPESKEWLDKRAKKEQRSLSFLVEEAISKARRLEEMAA